MKINSTIFLAIFLSVTSFAASWETLTFTNTGFKMNHIDALVKNNDNDGFVYMEAHSPAGDPRIQEIWQINAAVKTSESVSAWTKVIGGLFSPASYYPSARWPRLSIPYML